MDPIKEAFSKIKEDILSLKNEIYNLKEQISKINIPTLQQTNQQTRIQTIPTHNQTQTPQQTDIPTHNSGIPTHNYQLESPYSPNLDSSIGNKGVPTNKPTNTQTNQQTQYTQGNAPTHKQTNTYSNNPNSPLDFKQANEILESLDNIKKGIRLKFKRLTPQEMLVFSTLYTLEEQKMDQITYRAIATKLNLSESSIRDYTNKLIKKGIPIEKIRQNNKIIILKTSQDLKNVATLGTIHQLREL